MLYCEGVDYLLSIEQVASGTQCGFLQNVVAIDVANNQAFELGELNRRIVCVPNIDQLISKS